MKLWYFTIIFWDVTWEKVQFVWQIWLLWLILELNSWNRLRILIEHFQKCVIIIFNWSSTEHSSPDIIAVFVSCRQEVQHGGSSGRADAQTDFGSQRSEVSGSVSQQQPPVRQHHLRLDAGRRPNLAGGQRLQSSVRLLRLSEGVHVNTFQTGERQRGVGGG